MSRFLRPLGVAAQRSSVVRPGRAARSTGGRPSTHRHDGADAALVEALRAWRRQRSAEDEVPAYVVATDATLAAIAEQQPRTEGGLLAVPGIGPVKVAKYGVEILAIVEGRS